MAQKHPRALPGVWKEIQDEAATFTDVYPRRTDEHQAWVAETAHKIASRHARESLGEIAENMQALESLLRTTPSDYVLVWTHWLAMYVAVEIADADDVCGLKSFVHEWGGRGTIEPGNLVPIVAIGCYHDDESRDWLLALALDGDDAVDRYVERYPSSPSYAALQLLRGYEPDEAMRSKIELALQEEERKSRRPHPLRISREEALRSLLSSWDYAAGLENPSDRDRYRAFQSRLWRFYPIRPRGYHSSDAEYAVVAGRILADWQPGDERFVEWIFENPATTRDEALVAVQLGHKLTDPTRLQAVVDSDAPQAPFARQALLRFENAKKSPPPPPTQRSGFGGFGGFDGGRTPNE